MKQLLNFHRLQPGISQKTQLCISPLIHLGVSYYCTASTVWTEVPSQVVPFMITNWNTIGSLYSFWYLQHCILHSLPPWLSQNLFFVISFEWIHERIFHLYANTAFAQGCFSASHCNRVNHMLTTQPSSSVSGSLSISNFGNKWLKRTYWLLRVGFTSPTFSYSELRCQVWPGHLGFSRRIQYRGALVTTCSCHPYFFLHTVTGNTGNWLWLEF